MIFKDQNHTRFNTDDLNAIMAAIEEQNFTMVSTDHYQRQVAYTVQFENHIRKVVTASEEQISRSPRRRRHQVEGSNVARVNKKAGLLQILSLRALKEDSQHALALVGCLASETPVLPTSVAQTLIRTMMSGALTMAPYRATFSDELKRHLQSKIEEIATKIPIRIMPKVESGPVRRVKKTKEEKIEKLYSDSFYGTGGILEGPNWAWASGSRCPTGKWRNRISQAYYYYERELKARELHMQKLIDIAETPTRYESFAEYLRRMADEIEHTGRVR